MARNFAACILLTAASLGLPGRAGAREVEVVVYGGTPAGIAAAVAAADEGRSVLLVEPYRWVGGMVTNGLSHTDFRTFEGVTGFFLEFTHRVQSYYNDRYGPDSPQARGCFRGVFAEPHVNRRVFESMLAARPRITLLCQYRLEGTAVAAAPGGRRIAAATFRNPQGTLLRARAAVFIDATYEGDLMAAAGVAYRVGREARDEYGEALAPEKADSQVQGYNFRLMMTREAENRVAPAAPPDYRREEFLDVVPLLESGRLESIFCDERGGIYKAHLPPLPNAKHDVNDVSHGLVRLSLPELSDAWPTAGLDERARLFAAHRRHNVGLLYFLQNDPAVPARYRKEARRWGFCRDEFVENDHLPEQLYVREARRMVGQYVFTEHDTDYAPGDARAVHHAEAVAMGDYGPNCHGTGREGTWFEGRHTGEFYKPTPPYQIPYGVLVPKDVENLLVPVACSASHVGFCALRLEPIWSALGQASGVAAVLACKEGVPVQEVDVAQVQARLHRAGAATIYVSDVAPGDDDFAAVQWWATLGGWHGLAPQPETPGQRGAQITGQYFEAFPGHAAELDAPLDPPLRRCWIELAVAHGIDAAALQDARTRGELIRAAFAQHR